LISDPGKNKILSDLRTVQTGFEADPATYLVGSGSSFPEIRRPWYDAGHSHLSSTDLNNEWNRISISVYVLVSQWFMHVTNVKKKDKKHSFHQAVWCSGNAINLNLTSLFSNLGSERWLSWLTVFVVFFSLSRKC